MLQSKVISFYINAVQIQEVTGFCIKIAGSAPVTTICVLKN